MAKFRIYSKDGQTVRYEGCPKYSGTYLKVSYLEFSSVSSPVPIDWHVGDYVDYPRTGLRYTLRIVPSVAKRAEPGQSGNGFEYRNVKFMAQTQDLEVAPFVDLVPGDNGVHFSTQSDVSTYENAYGIAARIQACLDDLFPDRWDVRVYEGIDEDFKAKISEAVDFSIDGASCLSACDRMYETWGIGWTHYKDSSSGKDVLLFGRPNTRTADNTTDEFIFGPGNGLTAIRRSVANADELGTRLRVFGSMRNMLSDYYNGLDIYNAESVDIRNLMIPPSKWGQTEGKPDARKAYLQASGDAVEELGLIPRTHYFDGSDGEEIFPTLEGMTVGEIRSAKAEMQDTEHVPSETVYPDDSERVDEVKAVTNPTDDGYSGKSDGSKYKDTQIVSFAGLNSDPVSTLYDVTRRYTIFSNVAFPDNGLTVTVDSGMEGYINDADDFIRSLSIKLRLVTDEDDAHQLVSEVEVPFSPSDLSGTRYDFVLPSISLTRRNGSSVSLYLDLIAGVRPPSSQTNVRTFYVNLSGYSFVLGTSSPVSSDFQLTLKQIGFNLQDRASLTGEGLARVFMKDGMNAGRSFYVQSCTYEAEGDQWRLGMYRAEDESTGMRYPNTQFPIAAGDHFVLLDIAMPELYVGTAQQRLYEKGLEMLNDISRVKPYYEPEVDAKVMVEQSRTLREGMYMKLTDADLAGAESKYVLIDTLTINEGDKAIPTYRVSLREYRKKSFQETTDAAIDSAMKKVSGSSIDKPSSYPSTSVSYDGLTDKPSIDGTVLEGNKRSYDDLGLINKNFFELVNIGTETSPEYAIRAKYGLFSDYFISAHGSDPEAEAAAGLDIDELWSVLGASGTEKIDASHIPALGISAITGLQDALDSKLEGVTKGMVEAVLTGTVTSHDHDGRYAPLSDGLIPSQYLPGFVDDVLEYPSAASFPDAGESGKIYVALDTNLTYRWGGSGYVEISPSLALGHTSSTAYPGDEGAANAAAIQTLQGRFTGGAANKVAHSLTIVHDGGSTSASDKTFDGSAAVTVTIPTTLPASDVYAWAKAATKPSYTWGEIGGKPSVFTPAAHTHPLSEISDLHASWDALLKTAPAAFVTRWPAWGEVTGKPSAFTPAAHKHVKADITDFPTSWAWSAITGRPSTLAGYGITDGVNEATASGHLSASVSGHKLSIGVASGYAIPSGTQISLWNKIAALFDIDAGGNVYVTGDRGFYSNSFVSARGSDPEAGSGAGGLDVDELWSVLGASGTEKIDVSHIPALSSLSGQLTNAQLAYDSISVAGVTAALGGSVTTAQIAAALTAAGYKLTDTTYTLASFGITATAAEINKLDGLATTATELGYVHGVTSNIQTQLNAKQATITGAATSIVSSNLTANRALVSSSGGKVAVSAVSATELGYLDGVTSNIQAQLNSKANTSALAAYLPLMGGTLTGTLTTVDIYLPEGRNILCANEGGAGMVGFRNGRTTLGSIGPSTTAATHIRSITGHITTGLSDYATYNVLDTGNYASYAVSLTGAQTISGAKTFSSPVTAPALTYNQKYRTRCDSVGWYRCFTFTANNAACPTAILHISRIYNTSSGESYVFAISLGYDGKVSITQLSGTAGARIITKIRVAYVNSSTAYVDFYYSLSYSSGNEVYVSSSGYGISQTPEQVNDTTSSFYEFETSDGCKSDTYVTAGQYVYSPKGLFGLTEAQANSYAGSGYYKLAVGQQSQRHGASLLLYRDSTAYQSYIGWSTGSADHASIGLASGTNDLDITNKKGAVRLTGQGLTYNGYTVWHAGNDGSGSGLDANKLDGYYSTSFDLATNLGTGRDYGCYVIGLMQITDYTTLGNHANGELIFIRQNGNNPAQKIIYSLSTSYSSTNVRFGYLLFSTNSYVMPCTFTYNGKKWAGFNVTTASAYSAGIVCKRDGVRLGERSTPFLLKYRDSNTGQILNSEVNDSLVANGSDIIECGVSARSFVGALSGNASSATKLATARTLWGKPFDGSGNVSGDMTEVGSITMTGALSLPLAGSVGLLVDNRLRDLAWTVDTSGGWARSLKATDPTGSTTLINAVGVFGAGQTPKYVYLGGTSDSSPSMVITAAGTVGIGTTKPGYRLDVRGTGYFSGVLGTNGMTLPYGRNSWISMASTPAVLQGGMNQSADAAHPLFRVKNSAGDAIVFGGLGSNTGFYGFTAERISSGANSYDWHTTWNVGTGRLTHNGAMTVGGLLTASGGLTTPQYVQVGSGRLRWDAANNALYVEKSDGTACGLYSTGFLSSHDADPGAGTAAGTDTGAAVPQYDLVRPRRLASQTCYEGSVTDTTVSPNRVLTVSDQPPMLRFRGGKPGDGWSVEVYVRTSGGKNSKYKRVLTAPISECTADSGWENMVYESVVLPWSLMRIFFEKFDPTAGRFHSTPYVGATVGAAWANLVANSRKGSGVTSFTSIEKKRWYSPGADGGSIRSQASCLYAYAYFGVRLANDALGVHGDMKTFTISLRKATSSNLRNNDLSFTMRTD